MSTIVVLVLSVRCLLTHTGGDTARVIKVPDVAIPMQHGLLKRISAFQSKEVRLTVQVQA
jgi:hypothetical protein